MQATTKPVAHRPLDLNKFGGTYLNYADTVRGLVIKAGGYPSPEWFATQQTRILRAFDLGEPVEICADTIATFGKFFRPRSKTPRELAVRVVRA